MPDRSRPPESCPNSHHNPPSLFCSPVRCGKPDRCGGDRLRERRRPSHVLVRRTAPSAAQSPRSVCAIAEEPGPRQYVSLPTPPSTYSADQHGFQRTNSGRGFGGPSNMGRQRHLSVFAADMTTTAERPLTPAGRRTGSMLKLGVIGRPAVTILEVTSATQRLSAGSPTIGRRAASNASA